MENLSWAAVQADAQGITILVEPINGRDMPGYFIHRQDEAQAICMEIGAPNLRVQFDFYHAQIVEGDLSVKLRDQIALASATFKSRVFQTVTSPTRGK